jgi:hypothetical protein
MTKAHDKRLEAIERISKVRAEVEAKEAEAAAKVEADKQRKREAQRRWAEKYPEKAKAKQAKKNAKTKERHKARMEADPVYRAEVKAERAAKYQAKKHEVAAKRLARLEEVKAMRDKLTQLTTPYQFVENPMSMIQTMTDETLLQTLQLAVEEREKARKALQVLDAELADFVQHAEKDMPGIEYQAIGADIQGRVNKAVEQLQYAAKKWYHFSSEAKRRGLA